MASRVLAIVAAIGMIGGAYVFRYGLPGDGQDDANGGGGADAGAVVCASELGPVCDAVNGATVEPAATTADRLIAAASARAAGIAAWVVAATWPQMVDDARALGSRAPLFSDERVALASTPLVAVARRGQLPPACAAPTWRCLGDAAQDPAFRIGADGRTTTFGLFGRAAALGGFFGNSDYATNDLDEQPEARTWIDNVERRLDAAPGFGARSLDTFVLQQGSASVYLTSGAAAAGLAGNAQFEIAVPQEPVTVVAVVASPADGATGVDHDRLRDALETAGWSPARGNETTTGLPSPGVLLALSEVG
jgi:hypothetical protein